MRSVKVKAIIVNALNYTFQKGLLLKSDGNLREKGKGKREKSIGFSILPKQKTTRTRGCPLARVVLTNHTY